MAREHDTPTCHRRRLLLGAAGLSALAGCSRTNNESPGTKTTGPNETSNTNNNRGGNAERSSSDSGAEFEINDPSVNVDRPDIAESILVGEPVEIQFEITNNGDEAGSESVQLLVDELVQATRDVELEPSESVEISFTYEFDQEGDRELSINHVPVGQVTVVESLDHGRLVGAQYYSWYYGDEGWAGQNNPVENEGWLSDIAHSPLLGAYDSRDVEIINQHMKWSLEHGINWWRLNNGAPDTRIDRIIRNVVFDADLADQMNFTILFGFAPSQQNENGKYDFNDPEIRSNLVSRFQHWEDTKVGHDSYLHIDNRPTMYFWDANIYTGDISGAFAEAKAAVDVDPYIMSGVSYTRQPAIQRHQIEPFDAVLDYNSISTDEEYMERFHELTVANQRRWAMAADALDIDFIPSISPGRDASVSQGNNSRVPPVERDLGSFENQCTTLRKFGARGMAMVTSFNEWMENTQIEPSEEDGKAYLNSVTDNLAEPDWGEPEFSYQSILITFDRAISLEDGQPRSFLTSEIHLQSDTGEFIEDVGSLDEELVYLSGCNGRTEREGVMLRFFGPRRGEQAQTTLLTEFDEEIEGMVLRGIPFEDGIEVSVSIDGDELGSTTLHGGFGQGIQNYRIS
ncbi:CARDB domain-containing protein [Haloarchaeobius salinus]|uniref:CARDB domain-containing protein n=1 Tax=Haloarchaeobius salinus TaxID=1198298 RepID=UPI002108AFA4|nr:CARDB domain-containing protein [Haloarchaeobius salinus]